MQDRPKLITMFFLMWWKSGQQIKDSLKKSQIMENRLLIQSCESCKVLKLSAKELSVYMFPCIKDGRELKLEWNFLSNGTKYSELPYRGCVSHISL